MKKYRPCLYTSPIDLPEAVSGKLSIEYKTIKSGSQVAIVNMREALMTGKPSVYTRLETDLRIHELHEENVGIWMTDHPIELNQIAEALSTIEVGDRVLVGGHGLGILPKTLFAMGSSDITVVEISPDVIKLTTDGKEHYEVVCADLQEYLEDTTDRFDNIFLDIWQGTGERNWWGAVMPLRRIIRNRMLSRRVWCWAEDQMLSQVREAIARGIRNWFYECLPADMTAKTVEYFLTHVGEKMWERRFGKAVDEVFAKYGKELILD